MSKTFVSLNPGTESFCFSKLVVVGLIIYSKSQQDCRFLHLKNLFTSDHPQQNFFHFSPKLISFLKSVCRLMTSQRGIFSLKHATCPPFNSVLLFSPVMTYGGNALGGAP